MDRVRVLARGLVALALAGSARGQAAPALDETSGEEWIAEHEYREVRLEDDGTQTQQLDARIRVLSDAGARSWSRLVERYNSTREELEFCDARVLKPDGSVVLAPLSEVQAVTAPVAVDFPVYGDHRERRLTVPDLRPGDR